MYMAYYNCAIFNCLPMHYAMHCKNINNCCGNLYTKKVNKTKCNQREWAAQEREKTAKQRKGKKISSFFHIFLRVVVSSSVEIFVRAPMLSSDETSTAATDWCIIMPLPFLMSVDLVTISKGKKTSMRLLDTNSLKMKVMII